MAMKKILFIVFLFVCFAATAQNDGYISKVRYYAEIDSVLKLNSTDMKIDVSTLATGQFMKYDGTKFTNVTSAVGLDSLTNVGDGWLRVWYGGNVVDSTYFEQLVVDVDSVTIFGTGSETYPLYADTTKLATQFYVDQQIITSNGYNDEMAQDAVGGILDTAWVGDVKFHYEDALDSIWAEVKDDSHNHIISNVDNLQDSLDAKQDVVTGAATTVTDTDLDVSRALISNISGKIAVSPTISTTELSYLDNARDNIQQQIDSITAGTDDQTAAEVPITDAGGYYSSFYVEGALQEIGASLALASIDTMYYANDTLTTITPTDTFKVEIAIPASAGWDYSVQTLTSGTDTLNVSNGINAQLAITGNTAIRVENLQAGMSGNVTVTCSVNGYTLRFTNVTSKVSPYIPSASGIITTSASSGATDVYSWYWDGSYFIINGTQAYN